MQYAQDDDYIPGTTYLSYVSDEIPWEFHLPTFTLQCCTTHHEKLRGDLEQLDLQLESRQSLAIVLHFPGTFIDVYRNFGPTTNGFIDLM